MEPKELAEIAKYGAVITTSALVIANAGNIKNVGSDVANALYRRMLNSDVGHKIWQSYNEMCCRGYDLVNALDPFKNRDRNRRSGPAESLEQRISEMDLFEKQLHVRMGSEGMTALAVLEDLGLEENNKWYGGYDPIRREKRFGIRKEFGEQSIRILVSKWQMNLYERMITKISGKKPPKQKTQMYFLIEADNTFLHAGIYTMEDEVGVKGHSVAIYPKNVSLLLDSLEVPDKELQKDIETASRVIREVEENEVLRKKVLKNLACANYGNRQSGENSAEKILEAR